MKGKKLVGMSSVTLFVLCIIAILGILRVNTVFPSDKPTLWVDDYEFCSVNNLTCTNFNITVNIFNVTDMKGCEVKLGYNATIIHAIRVYPTDITNDATTWLPPNATGQFNFDRHPVINNTRTYAPNYAYVWVGARDFTTFTGNGAVFTVEFHIEMVPPRGDAIVPSNKSVSCVLDLYETEVLDYNTDPIDHYLDDGSYTYLRPQRIMCCFPMAKCSVYPSTVYMGENVTFDGSGSEASSYPIARYLWDVNSDGTYEINTTSAIVSWYCDTRGNNSVTLVVVAEGPCDDVCSWGCTCYWTVYVNPVGGIYIPVNKLELLAPYIGLTILLAVAVTTVVYVKKRKRD